MYKHKRGKALELRTLPQCFRLMYKIKQVIIYSSVASSTSSLVILAAS